MAEIIQLRDYQQKRDIEKLYRELQEQASAIMDTMAVYTQIGIDTSPCEYSAPSDDCA